VNHYSISSYQIPALVSLHSKIGIDELMVVVVVVVVVAVAVAVVAGIHLVEINYFCNVDLHRLHCYNHRMHNHLDVTLASGLHHLH